VGVRVGLVIEATMTDVGTAARSRPRLRTKFIACSERVV
jgi:hypothetical protein